MENELIENTYGYKVTIEELRSSLDRVYDGFTELKNAVRSIFGTTTLIVSLIGALKIFSAQVSPPYLMCYNILLVIVMALYIVMIIGSVYIQNPKLIVSPTPADWETLESAYVLDKDNSDVSRQLISSYINAIVENQIIISRHYKLTWGISAILPIIIIILLVMSLIPRVPVP
jgi:hypothetical protein